MNLHRYLANKYLPKERILKPTPELFLGGEENPLYKQYAEELAYLEKSGIRSGVEAILANERYFVKLFGLKVVPYDFSNEGNNTQQYDYSQKKGYDNSWLDRIILYSFLSKFYKKQQNKGNAGKYAEPAQMLEYMADNRNGSMN